MIDKLVRTAAQAYYEGNPIMSDEIYDHLLELASIEDVGYSANSEKRFPHLYPMFSLQKIWDAEDRPMWKEAFVSPKLDGAAVSILIGEGILQKVLTRGDGKEGLDITHLMRYKLPTHFPNQGVYQITGEVVAPKSIPNARNYAAGALGLKDAEEFKTRDVRFVAYGIEPSPTEDYHNDLRFIETLGFTTVKNLSNPEKYPQDGMVVRMMNNADFYDAGFTSHHPRGAYALKEREKGVVTKLLDVEWQVGKSGAVSPVAILEPVMIEDAVVSRASLHNKGIIEALELEIGCQVEVIRAGKIIPQIVGRIDV